LSLCALFTRHAFVARFGARLGLDFWAGVQVKSGLAVGLTRFGLSAFAAATAVAVLAWATAVASSLAATRFAALCTLTARRAFATGFNRFRVALVAAFGAAFGSLTTLGAVTPAAPAGPAAASAIGAAAIAALTALAGFFVIDGGLRFLLFAAAEQACEPAPHASFGFGWFGNWLRAAGLGRSLGFDGCCWLGQVRGGRCIRQNAFDHGRLLICGLL